MNSVSMANSLHSLQISGRLCSQSSLEIYLTPGVPSLCERSINPRSEWIAWKCRAKNTAQSSDQPMLWSDSWIRSPDQARVKHGRRLAFESLTALNWASGAFQANSLTPKLWVQIPANGSNEQHESDSFENWAAIKNNDHSRRLRMNC